MRNITAQRSLASLIIRDFISLFYPDYCLGCSNALVKGENFLCSRCMVYMPQTNYHSNPDNALKLRLSGRIPIKYALSFYRFNKTGRIQKVLHALKYKNEPEVGVVLGRVYGDKLKKANYSFDLILPVPLHPSRFRRRGYNQSAKFAQGLSQTLTIPYREDVIFRKVQTQTQTKKSKLHRWENVNNVFGIKGTPDLRGKHILLVDDVITTGATLEACALALIEGGCSLISIASIAVA